MATTGLHNKYRPKRFEDVVGQDLTVRALRGVLDRKKAHVVMLSGPAGCGKTTLARIAAYYVGCDDVLEIDAATNTGIDAMREIQITTQYQPMMSESRAVIVDECHKLSGAAWTSLLKTIEEPPEHAYWFFCTTEPGKVPPAIKQRCQAFAVKPVPDALLDFVIDKVCKKEGIDIDDSVRDIVIKEAHGSPRQALVNLENCRDVKTKKEAASILRAAADSDAVRDLCQFLLKGGSWAKVSAILERLEDESPESVRIVVMNYMAAVIKGPKPDPEVIGVLGILDAFSQPYNQSENLAPLYLSVGRVLFGGA